MISTILESDMFSLHQDNEFRPQGLCSQCYPRGLSRSPASEPKGHHPARELTNDQSPAKPFIGLSPLDLFNPLHESLLLQKQYKRKIHPTQEGKKTIVTFCERVRVKKIPSHRYLDEEERNSLWISWDELAYGMRRNTMEYLADGSDWRQAKEEDQFKLLPSGELMHPLWCSLPLQPQLSAQKCGDQVEVSNAERTCVVSTRHSKPITNAAA
jgi:hypothetical protein